MLDRLAMTLHSWMVSAPVFAENGSGGEPVGGTTAWDIVATNLLVAIVYTLVGIVLFGLAIWLFVKIAPFPVQKEIEEDQNTSLGIIMGSLILGIALILAAAIHG